MPLDSSRVLNSHKNKLLEITRASNLPLSLFERSEDHLTFTIRVRNTKLRFRIVQSPLNFNSFFCDFTELEPGFPEDGPKSPRDIGEICSIYKSWLSHNVKKYLELESIPDQWAEMVIIQPMVSSKSFTQEDFEMFTENEKKQIQDSLSEFQCLLKDELDPMKEKLDGIQEKLDYLSSAVNRLNRFDWKGVALSTVIGIATNLSVDINTGKQVFDLFQQAFGSVVKLLPK